MSQFQSDSIFWVEIDKIRPNPFQPRREFDEARLSDLAESIRQYGVLQPLVVTRYEVVRDDGIAAEYELIAGERRLRASKVAGLSQVPVIIRSGEESDRMKLELAIIENLQREDLNPVDRAQAFERLVSEFGFNHVQVARKIGRSREYVSNSIRILMLPPTIRQAVAEGKVSEGHTRPLLMLNDRSDEQATLFKEIIYKQITVRESESIARKIATEKARKSHSDLKPELLELEGNLSESLGTRVRIEQREVGGKIVIDYFSEDDLRMISEMIRENKLRRDPSALLDKYIEEQERVQAFSTASEAAVPVVEMPREAVAVESEVIVEPMLEEALQQEEPLSMGEEIQPALDSDSSEIFEIPETSPVEEKEDEGIYSVRHFTI